jgi:serine/threonine protein kinase
MKFSVLGGVMEHVTSGLSGQTYRVGQALPALGEGFCRGFVGTQEVTLRLAPAGTPAVALLRAEATLLDRLDHPQLARLVDRGRTTQTFFLVFGDPAGRPLAELIHQADLAATAALDIVTQVIAIVAALHAAGLAWGRLRPQAFWADKAGRLKLIDLRGAGEPVASGSLTLAQATYMAPELGAGQLPTESGDVYACAALAYELLAGRPPFIGASPTDLAVKHLVEPPPDLRRLRPELPAELATLIERGLSKAPADRPPSLAALREELAAIRERLLAEERARMLICPRCQGQVLPAERCPLCNAPLSPPPAAPQRRPRKLLPLIAIGLSCIALLCMLVGSLSGSSNAAASSPSIPPAPATPTSATTPSPTAVPTPAPTATAVRAPAGTFAAPAGDVADPDIDLIAVRASHKPGALTLELAVAGRIDGQAPQRIYQAFFDIDGPDSGDRHTPWAALGADYAILYRSGEEAAMVLRWDGAGWQGVGTAAIEVNGGTMTMRTPAEWLDSTRTLRYGVLATNSGANLADYVPPRDSAGATLAGD